MLLIQLLLTSDVVLQCVRLVCSYAAAASCGVESLMLQICGSIVHANLLQGDILLEGLQMTESTNELCFVHHICSNLHSPILVHCLEKLKQLLLVGCD